MHLANRKGSRYADPKPASFVPVNGAVSAGHASRALTETAGNFGGKAANEVAPVQRREKV
jgi:hypothetical protein